MLLNHSSTVSRNNTLKFQKFFGLLLSSFFLSRPIKGKLIRIGNETKNGQNRCNEKMDGYQSVYDGKQLDTVNAEVAFEEYDALIEKLKNSITYKLKLQLRETLSEKAELTAIETENIKREGKGFK